MANQTVNFKINLDRNAYTGIVQIDAALGNVLVNAKNTKSFFERYKTAAFNFDVITNAIGKVLQAFQLMVVSSLDFEQQANMRMLLNGDAVAADSLVLSPVIFRYVKTGCRSPRRRCSTSSP